MMCQNSGCITDITGDEYEMVRIESDEGVLQDFVIVCLDCAQAGDSS